MAKTITIRRVGSIFPALCLVVIVLVCFSIAWLSFVGLPDFVLRKIEQQAEPYGLNLKLEKLKLAPTSGLAVKAQNLRITTPLHNAYAELSARKLQVSFSIFELLQGNYQPNNIHLLDMRVQLPMEEENANTLLLSNADTHINLFNRGERLRIDSSADIQGIKLNFKGEFPLSKLQNTSITTEQATEQIGTQPTLQLDKYITPVLPWLRKAEEHITRQQWSRDQFPQLDINLRYRGKQPTAEIKARVPSFRQGEMHFHNVSLYTRYEDKTFTIDHLNFATKTPHTEVALQGSFDVPNRRLTFNLRSSAAIAQIVEMLDDSQKGSLLSRLCADAHKAPTIKLRGQVEFSENNALNNISLRGNILQRDFFINNTEVQSFELSFLLSDGKFNIDKLNLTLPDGNITASALTGYDHADATIGISLPFNTLVSLTEGICGHSISLPESLKTRGRLKLDTNLLLSVNTFNPGTTKLADLIPSLKEIQHLSIELDSLQYGNLLLVSPKLQLKASDILHPTVSGENSLRAKDLTLSLDMGKLEMPDTLTASQPSLHLTIDNISADGIHPLETLHLIGVRAEATINKLSSGGITAENISLNINNLPDYDRAKEWAEMLVKSNINIHLHELTYQNHSIASDLTLSVEHPRVHEANVLLSFFQQEKELRSLFSFEYQRIEQDGILNFSLNTTELPLLVYAPFLQELDVLPTAIELPETLTLTTGGSININNGQLGKCSLSLHVPKLIRTPQTLFVNKGKRIPLDITLNADFQSDKESITYSGNVKILHSTGDFRADISGNLHSFCTFSNGHNTISVNIIDSLIDDEDAHAIMRDFRFGQDSQVSVSNIETKITYDNGICVKSFCKADIRNTDFLIGAIEDVKDKKGNIIGERLRTDMGDNPYSRVFQATCDVLVDVQMGMKKEDGSPAPEKMQLVLNSPYLNYDNRPWLRRQGIKQGTPSSIIRGESIVFDLDNSGIVLNNLTGKAYPAYAFGMYFAPLQEFMKDIRLQYPVEVNTKRCEFPISARSQVPISGLIRAESAAGAAFDFLGTTIPLNRFSGFVNLSDDFVFLDKMNARTWGGVLNGAIKIGISGKSTSFDGQLTAANLNLQNIGNSYNTDLSPALCNATIRFQSPTSEVKDVKAYGSATIRDGNLMELGIFQPIGSLISDLPGQLADLQRKVTGKTSTPAEEDKPGMISRFLSAFTNTTDTAISKVDASSRHIPFANHFMSYNIQNAELKFDILNGYLYTRDMKADGYNLEVDMNLRLNLDTLDLRGNLWPRISSVPTLVIAPITFLSDFLIDIVIYGNIEDIQWKFTLDRIIKTNRKKHKPSITVTEE